MFFFGPSGGGGGFGPLLFVGAAVLAAIIVVQLVRFLVTAIARRVQAGRRERPPDRKPGGG